MHTNERDHLQRDFDKSNAMWRRTVGKKGNRASRTGGDRHRPLIVIFTNLERHAKGNDDVTLRRAYQSKDQKDKRSQSRDSSQGNRKKRNYWGNERSFQGGQHRRDQARSRSPARKDNYSTNQGNTRGTITPDGSTSVNNWHNFIEEQGQTAQHLQYEHQKTNNRNQGASSTGPLQPTARQATVSPARRGEQQPAGGPSPLQRLRDDRNLSRVSPARQSEQQTAGEPSHLQQLRDDRDLSRSG